MTETKAEHKLDLIADGEKITLKATDITFKVDETLIFNSIDMQRKMWSPSDISTNMKYLLTAIDAAFGNQDRFRIILSCKNKPQNFNYLKNNLDIPSPALTYHLRKLCDSWLLYKDEKGQYIATLLGNLILQYFTEFLEKAEQINLQLQ